MKKIKKIDFPSEKFPQKLSLCSSVSSIPDIYKVRNRLEKHFPDEQAFRTFFAQGSRDRHGVTSWQITNDTQTGDLYLLSDFDQDERDKIEKICNTLENKIRTWLENNRSASQFEEDIALFENLLIYPKTNSLFAGTFDRAGKKTYFPVRVGWACQLTTNEAGPRGGLTTDADPLNIAGDTDLGVEAKKQDAAPVPKEPLGNDTSALAQPSIQPFPYFFLWLLNLLLILIIGFLLIPACNLKLFGSCDAEQFFSSPLVTKVSQLELQLNKEIKFCNENVLEKKVTVIEDVGPESPQTDLTEVDKRLDKTDANFGMLNFTLVWNTSDDLDLFITCPNGGKISYLNKTSIQNGCGSLDVDRNSRSSGVFLDPIEHIIVDEASLGDEFILEVGRHARNGSSASKVDFSLIVKSDRVLKRFDGQVMNNGDNWKAEYLHATD